jgi:hypothetical protein
VLCVIITTRGRRQCFGVLIVRPVCVEGCFQTYHTKLNYLDKAISNIKTSVYTEYSLKVSLKSSNYWGNNALLKPNLAP